MYLSFLLTNPLLKVLNCKKHIHISLRVPSRNGSFCGKHSCVEKVTIKHLARQQISTLGTVRLRRNFPGTGFSRIFPPSTFSAFPSKPHVRNHSGACAPSGKGQEQPHAGVSDLVAPLGHPGRRRVVSGHLLNTQTLTNTDEQGKRGV